MAFIADEHQQGQSLGSDGDGSGSIQIQNEQDTSHGASTTAGGATNQSVILATAGYDHVIKFWDPSTGNCYRDVKFSDSQINCLQVTQDRKYLAAAGNPHVRLYEINSKVNTHLTNYSQHKGNVTSIQFQNDAKVLYTGSEDGTIKAWDMRVSTVAREFKNNSPINEISLHPNQCEIISCDQEGRIRKWDMGKDGSEPLMDSKPDGNVSLHSLDIAVDGSVGAVVNNSGNAYFWNPNEPEVCFEKLEAHKGQYVLKCRISPDKNMMATTSADHTVKLWDLKSRTLSKTLISHQRWVWDCTFSADSSYLVTCSSDHTARLWEIERGEVIRHYTGHHKAVICCALNDTSPA